MLQQQEKYLHQLVQMLYFQLLLQLEVVVEVLIMHLLLVVLEDQEVVEDILVQVEESLEEMEILQQ
tara:strand:+ start:176 stop:373 length:198 start_codon:yes stop_codon:yes gene_type:complete